MELLRKESSLERDFVGLCSRLGIQQFKLSGEVGAPDRVLLYKGQCLFIEFKREKKGVVSKAQKIFIDELKNMGFAACIINNGSELSEILKEFIES